jgi:hypothetical protein
VEKVIHRKNISIQKSPLRSDGYIINAILRASETTGPGAV